MLIFREKNDSLYQERAEIVDGKAILGDPSSLLSLFFLSEFNTLTLFC